MKLSPLDGASSQPPNPPIALFGLHSAGSPPFPSNVADKHFQEHVFKAFGGYRKFWKKVGIYLRAVTGDSCRFTLERFGRRFIVLRIRKPCEYYKGINLEDLAGFFGVDLYERSEYGAERSDASLVIFGGGGGG